MIQIEKENKFSEDDYLLYSSRIRDTRSPVRRASTSMPHRLSIMKKSTFNRAAPQLTD